MMALPGIETVLVDLESCDMNYYSLITLAILPQEGRNILFDLCRRVRRAGGLVAFDSNYRPSLWASASSARQACGQAMSCCNIGLPTLVDEAMLFGEQDAARASAAWKAKGAQEVAVKLGKSGCLVADHILVPPSARIAAVDTSGAGDAFNAGYLGARLTGSSPEDAAHAGNRLAGWVAGHAGAIPPIDEAAAYQLPSARAVSIAKPFQ